MSEDLELLKPTSLAALREEINNDLTTGSLPEPSRCSYEKLEPVTHLVTDNEIVELQEFIDKHRVECGRHCLADMRLRPGGQNLLQYALTMKQFKVYAVLQTNFIKKSATECEKFEAKQDFEKLDEKDLEELRAQIRARFIRPEAYIKLATNMSPLVRKLMLKTRLASNYFHMKAFHEMRQRYEKLEAMDQVRPMLVVIAASEGLEIVCDFFEYTIMYMQPNFGLYKGLCYFKINLILLACKETTSSTLTTPIHEFIHYLMNVLYGNESMPYAKNDIDREAAYLKALTACVAESEIVTNRDLKELIVFRDSFHEDWSIRKKQVKEINEIWDNKESENFKEEWRKFHKAAIAYDNELRRKKRAEAICLPATIPIDFSGDDTKLKRYRQCLAPMFDFYNEYTLPDIIKKSKEIEAEWESKDQT